MAKKFEGERWEFESRWTYAAPAGDPYAVVMDAKDRVLFDTSNADASVQEIHQEPDDEGVTYHQRGPAVDALKLAAMAPEMLELLRQMHKCIIDGFYFPKEIWKPDNFRSHAELLGRLAGIVAKVDAL